MAVIIVKTISDLETVISKNRALGNNIGFVPTMGALHQGHLHLIHTATQTNDCVIASIFVNPTQFYDPGDFERYPRTLDSDIQQLNSTTCQILFIPQVDEIYPLGYKPLQIDLNGLDTVMEGAHRKGHFAGVVNVVSRFFELIQPNEAFFGLKDYQQYLIIKRLAKINFPSIKIIGIETVREQTGLALSSRNKLLTKEQYLFAPVIYEVLCDAKKSINSIKISQIKMLIEQRLHEIPDLKIDYIEIADSETLDTVNEFTTTQKARIFIALFLGRIRLIDNIAIN